MASRDLNVDPSVVQAGSGLLGGTAAAAPPVSAPVVPFAGDSASVQIANWVSAAVAALDRAVTEALRLVDQAGVRLAGNAADYLRQESASTAELGGGGVGAGAVPAALSPGELGALEAPPPESMPMGAQGVRPMTGPQVSQIVHTGPGTAPMAAVAGSVDARAAVLAEVEGAVSAARALIGGGWESPAAHEAQAHLARLETTLGELTSDARSLAHAVRTQIGTFEQVKAVVPRPEVHAEARARLMSAIAVNSAPGSMGTLQPVIAQMYRDIAALDRQSMDGRDRLEDQANLLGPAADTGAGGPGLSGVGPTGVGEPHPAAAGAVDPPGAGAGAEVIKPMVGSGAGAIGKIVETLIPAAVTAVTSTAQGFVGAGSALTSSVGGVGGTLAGNFAKLAAPPASATQAGAGGNGDPQHGGSGSGGQKNPQLTDADEGGGGEPGDTQPSSAPGGALVAPAGGAAMAAAAPATVSAAPPPPVPAAPTAGPVTGPGMMAPMMGAPMGGRGGDGGGEHDRRLYPERRLRIETPPNSEPVKGRREVRRSRDDKSRDGGGL